MNSILVCYPNHTPTVDDIRSVIVKLFTVSDNYRLVWHLAKEGGGWHLYYGKQGTGHVVYADDGTARLAETCQDIIDDATIC